MVIARVHSEWALEHLCDPEQPAWMFMPTPYMDLPAFISGAKDILEKQPPPPKIRGRLRAAVFIATELLKAVNA